MVNSSLEESASLKALFFPEVAIVVIAALFPEIPVYAAESAEFFPGLSHVHRAEFRERAQEFGALPEIALRHHRPQRSAVLYQLGLLMQESTFVFVRSSFQKSPSL